MEMICTVWLDNDGNTDGLPSSLKKLLVKTHVFVTLASKIDAMAQYEIRQDFLASKQILPTQVGDRHNLRAENCLLP